MDKSVNKPLLETIHSGWIGQGKKVEEFEKMLAKRFDDPRVLTLSAGTHGLHLALHLAGIQRGDEVITTALTCTASNWPISYCGADMVWADIKADDLNIDYRSVHERITKYTKAIICVHWGGYPADLQELETIANEYNLFLIEDAAHAFGTTYKETKIGDCKYSDYVMMSFQAIKHLTCVDGGALFAKSNDDYAQGKLLRWYGIDREGPRTDFRCLHPQTKIKLPHNQSSKSIVNIFKNKFKGPILSVKDNKIIKNQIVDWHKSPLGNRYFLKISTDGSTPTRKSIVTNDHKILTSAGYKRADELKNGDLIATPYPDLSEIQKSIVIGSILGDATLTKKGPQSKRAVLYENHSMIQKEYIELKAKSLSGLGINVIYRKPDRLAKHPNGQIVYHTHSLPILSKYRNIFYPNGKKIIPRELVEKNLNNLILAIWIMDDGRTQVANQKEGIVPYAELALNAYEKDDVEWLSYFFIKNGYDCTLKNFSGWRIFFSKKGTAKLMENISSYVLPSMRYKVAHRKMPKFDEKLWGDGKSPVYYDKALIEPYTGKNYSHVYCLSMDNGSPNFLTTSAVVHNCEQDVEEIGWKYHMNDVCATIGMANFKSAERNVNLARENAAYYRKELTDIDGITLLQNAEDRQSSYWLFTILVENRNEFFRMMGEKGISVSRVHERNDRHTCVKQFKRELPVLDSIIDKMCCLPVGWWVNHEDRAYIAETIKSGW